MATTRRYRKHSVHETKHHCDAFPSRQGPLSANFLQKDPMSGSKTPQRGWFEGTLDVISGMAPRSTTPTPQLRSNGSFSAPNSPMRRDQGMIQRLPSQDSLDRAMHNDSGHGKKSTAQIIRELKQSNARLTAKTAALEADFMNQLNEVTRKYEDKQQKLEETILKSEKLTSSLEHRCQVAEGKLKENNESLTRLREDSAFQRHTISDLRTQLDWAQNKVTEGEWLDEKDKLLRELRLTQEQVKAEIEDKEKLRKKLIAAQAGEGGAALAEALRETQETLERVREEGHRQQAEHQKVVSLYKEQLDKAPRSAQFPISEKEEKEADSTLVSQELEETRAALQSLRKELEKTKAQAVHQEQYRQEEADDLRLLNDAQEEEIQRLRSDLDEAVKELELRDRELEERNNELKESRSEGLAVSDKEIEAIRTELKETKEAKESEGNHLLASIEKIQSENKLLRDQIQALESAKQISPRGDDSTLSLEQRNVELEESIGELRTKLSDMERESSHKLDYKAQLLARESELKKLKQKISDAASDTENYKQCIANLEKELQESKEKLASTQQKLEKALSDSRHQSGGEYEEDLRKEVASLRQTRKELRAKIEALEDDSESLTSSLRDKLTDRDTTIAALVKSNVTMESELSSARIELQLYKARLTKSQEADDGDEGVDVILARSEEVAELRDSLAAYKETESRMAQEVSRLEKQVTEIKWENIRLRRQKGESTADDAASSAGSVVSISGPSQIMERDEAIARLVKQTVNQEKEIQSLRTQMEKYSGGGSMARSSSTEKEIEQLRQESEMFAGQVIELDEEIEKLRLSLDEREIALKELKKENAELRGTSRPEDKDDKIAALMTEIYDLKSRPMADGNELDRIRTLEAEVDELREANSEQMTEIRALRRSSRDSRTAADELATAKNQVAEAESKIAELRNVIDVMSQELETLKIKAESYEESYSLKGMLVNKEDMVDGEGNRNAGKGFDDTDEFEALNVKEELDRLRSTVTNQASDLDRAKRTIRELEKLVAEKKEDAMAHWEDEKEELMADIEDLSRQLETARQELADVEKERNLIEDFKFKLEQADEEREKSEQNIIDTFERKISLLTLDKDVTIDKLRKELVAAKEGSSANVEELQAEIEDYRMKLDELGERATSEIEQRDSRIFALENTLDASKQLVSNMRTEMDHLQGSMEHAVADRKEEIEDMQQELVDLTAMTARQERELGAMRMKLEEKHLAHEAEVSTLQETISRLEGEKASFVSHRNAHDMQMDLRVREVKEKLEKLKWRNQSLQDENESLRLRVAKLEAHSKADFVDRAKYEKLQSDLSEMKNEVQNLQMQLEDARAVVVTPAPTLPPGSAERKKGSKRMGFLGRRRGAGEENTSF
jgi:chromosome segregation ATPase